MTEADDRKDQPAAEDPMTEEQASYLRSLGESGGPLPPEVTQEQAAARIRELRDDEERVADRPGRGTRETYRGQRDDDDG